MEDLNSMEMRTPWNDKFELVAEVFNGVLTVSIDSTDGNGNVYLFDFDIVEAAKKALANEGEEIPPL